GCGRGFEWDWALLSVPRGAERRVNFSAACRLIIAAGSRFPGGVQRSGSGEATVETQGSSTSPALRSEGQALGEAWEMGVWQPTSWRGMNEIAISRELTKS